MTAEWNEEYGVWMAEVSPGRIIVARTKDGLREMTDVEIEFEDETP